MWKSEMSLYTTCDQGSFSILTNGMNYNVDAEGFQGKDDCGTNIQPDYEDPEPEPEPEVNFPINVNTVDFETLQHIPGVGEAIAQNIIDYREQYGPYKEIQDLLNNKYIGPARLEEMRPYITLG